MVLWIIALELGVLIGLGAVAVKYLTLLWWELSQHGR